MEPEAAQRAFARCGTLADVIRAGLALRPAWSVIDVVTQDEYTLDVVLQPDGGGPAVVLDCT